jgi:hypothetical protein
MYVRGNPLRYTDPSGHFTEDQIVDWYGSEWRSKFSTQWQALLLQAQFGDLLLSGIGQFSMFVTMNGGLALWDMQSKTGSALTGASSNGSDLALYRRQGWDGGYTHALPRSDTNAFMFGDETATYNRVNSFVGLSQNHSENITIQGAWWLGSDSWVGAEQQFVKFDPMSTRGGAQSSLKLIQSLKAAMAQVTWKEGAKTALKTFVGGGVSGVGMTGWMIYDWSRYDTIYSINSYVPGTVFYNLRERQYGH